MSRSRPRSSVRSNCLRKPIPRLAPCWGWSPLLSGPKIAGTLAKRAPANSTSGTVTMRTGVEAADPASLLLGIAEPGERRLVAPIIARQVEVAAIAEVEQRLDRLQPGDGDGDEVERATALERDHGCACGRGIVGRRGDRQLAGRPIEIERGRIEQVAADDDVDRPADSLRDLAEVHDRDGHVLQPHPADRQGRVAHQLGLDLSAGPVSIHRRALGQPDPARESTVEGGDAGAGVEDGFDRMAVELAGHDDTVAAVELERDGRRGARNLGRGGVGILGRRRLRRGRRVLGDDGRANSGGGEQEQGCKRVEAAHCAIPFFTVDCVSIIAGR